MRLSLLLQALRFLRTPPAELPRLIDQGCRKKFRRVELADCEAVKPCLLAAGQALNLSAPHVPELDVNAVGAALAKQQNSHSRQSTVRGEEKANVTATGSGDLRLAAIL